MLRPTKIRIPIRIAIARAPMLTALAAISGTQLDAQSVLPKCESFAAITVAASTMPSPQHIPYVAQRMAA
jgi:hypothetical protein